MTDYESENPDLDTAMDTWRDQFGDRALLTCRQDVTGYDFVEIRTSDRVARIEQETGGWCLYDLGGDEPTALTDCVTHPSGLTTAIGRFVRGQTK